MSWGQHQTKISHIDEFTERCMIKVAANGFMLDGRIVIHYDGCAASLSGCLRRKSLKNFEYVPWFEQLGFRFFRRPHPKQYLNLTIPCLGIDAYKFVQLCWKHGIEVNKQRWYGDYIAWRIATTQSAQPAPSCQ